MNSGPDVVVAGAGMAGALFANLLARSEHGRDLDIALVDPKASQRGALAGGCDAGQFDPRVVAVTEHSRQLLARVDAWQGLARYCPYLTMEVRDTEGTGVIRFDCDDVHTETLGHIVENSLIVEALLQNIAALGNVRLLSASIESVVSHTEDGVVLALSSGEQLQPRLLVAADGAASPVREMCGLAVREWSYEQRAIVTTITTEKPHRYCARQWFSPAGPLAFLPLRDDAGDCQRCSIVWSQHSDHAEALMALDDTAFCLALERASEGTLGAVVRCEKRFALPLRQRHAIDYVTTGVVLLGDAAHSIHPLAGQGANLGFKDAQVLVEELQRALTRGLLLGSAAVLERYQRRRKPDNLGMMAAMETFKRLFESEAPPLRLLRNEGMRYLDRLGMAKNILAKQAMGIG